MSGVLAKVVRLLLDEVQEQDDEIERRLAALESWKEKVEAVWPEVDNGTD